MIESDFDKYDIINFTPKEVEETGAKLIDVKKETIISIQKFRTYIRRRVGLLKNGLTTGIHKAPWHPLGLASDSFLYLEDGRQDIHIIFKGALHSGFRGIGLYWNQKQYSFHFDHRPSYAQWLGIKDESRSIDTWQFFSLLRDPTKIRLRG